MDQQVSSYKSPAIRASRYRLLLLRSLISILFLIALIHRFWGLGTYPSQHETHDEYHNLWVGMSLINGDAPTAWSHLEAVPKDAVGSPAWNQIHFPLVRPAFDHPPLYDILLGAVGWLSPHKEIVSTVPGVSIWAVNVWYLRLISMALFSAAFWQLFAICRRAASPSVSVLACAFYAFLEPVVVHGRLAVADNLIVVLFLFLLQNLERSGRRSYLTTSTTIAAMILTKLIAASAIPAVAAWEAVRKSSGKHFYSSILGAALASIVLCTYFWVYGWTSAIVTLRVQSNRFYDFGGFFDLIRHQPLVHQDSTNLWLMSGWIALFADLKVCGQKQRAVYAAFIGYLAGYIFFVPMDYYGWYAIPFYPVLCIAIASAVRRVYRHPLSLHSLVSILLVTAAALSPIAAEHEELRPFLRYFYAALVALLLWPVQAGRTLRIRLIRIALPVLICTGWITEIAAVRKNEAIRLKDQRKKDKYGTFVT